MADKAQTTPEAEFPDPSQLPLIPRSGRPLLICVFIHGFKGTDTTFGKFPARLRHILSETIEHSQVECVVFPAYETKGDLKVAVEKFADWLCTLTVEREVAHGAGGGAGKARIVLCGHSMGGLLAADTLLSFANSRVDASAPLWPNIVACIAYDTPFLGLHPFVFKNTASQAIGYAQTARDLASALGVIGGSKTAPASSSGRNTPDPGLALVASKPPAQSGWSRWAPAIYGVGGALLATAAAGTAYYNREDVASGWKWASDHMKYVGTLWDEKTLRDRLDNLTTTCNNLDIVFKVFYTILPANPPDHPHPRTFVILPKAGTKDTTYFLPIHNRKADDEVGAHTGMFDPTTNDEYYSIGLETAHLIQEAVRSGPGSMIDQADHTSEGVYRSKE